MGSFLEADSGLLPGLRSSGQAVSLSVLASRSTTTAGPSPHTGQQLCPPAMENQRSQTGQLPQRSMMKTLSNAVDGQNGPQGV